MSSVKTVLILVVATIILGVVAYGSWFASSKIFKEPEVNSGNDASSEFDKNGNPTSVAIRNYQPVQVKVVKNDAGALQINWESTKSVTTLFYVTYDKSEKITDVLKNWGKGTLKGNMMVTSSDSKTSTAHSVTIPKYYWEGFLKSSENTDKKLYYFIIVNVSKSRLPYGDPKYLDSTKGPTQGFTIDLTSY